MLKRCHKPPNEPHQSSAHAAPSAGDLMDTGAALGEVGRLLSVTMGDLLDEAGHLRPLNALPDHVAAAIASVRIVRRGPAIVYKVQLWDKSRILGRVLEHFRLMR